MTDTVARLQDEVRRQVAATGRADIWVRDDENDPVGLTMALVVDTVLSLGLMPAGFTQGDGGRTYHYE